MELSGRVALITGAAGGIGRALVRRFADAGARVVATDLADSDVDGAATSAAMDVSDPAAVAEVVQAFGPIDVLVNNAAATGSLGESFLDGPMEVWDRQYAVTVKGAVHCARAVLPAMLARRSGSIVNIASVNALMFYGHPAYSAAKAALVSLTRSLAALYGGHGVRVNAIAPGTIRTPVWDARLETDPEKLDRLARWYPLGRIGEPGEIAEAACFLASDRSAWISGVVLPVDGALTAGNLPMAADTGGA